MSCHDRPSAKNELSYQPKQSSGSLQKTAVAPLSGRKRPRPSALRFAPGHGAFSAPRRVTALVTRSRRLPGCRRAREEKSEPRPTPLVGPFRAAVGDGPPPSPWARSRFGVGPSRNIRVAGSAPLWAALRPNRPSSWMDGCSVSVGSGSTVGGSGSGQAGSATPAR